FRRNESASLSCGGTIAIGHLSRHPDCCHSYNGEIAHVDDREVSPMRVYRAWATLIALGILIFVVPVLFIVRSRRTRVRPIPAREIPLDKVRNRPMAGAIETVYFFIRSANLKTPSAMPEYDYHCEKCRNDFTVDL